MYIYCLDIIKTLYIISVVERGVIVCNVNELSNRQLCISELAISGSMSTSVNYTRDSNKYTTWEKKFLLVFDIALYIVQISM